MKPTWRLGAATTTKRDCSASRSAPWKAWTSGMGCARRGLSAAVDDLARLDVATLFMVWLGFLVNTLALRTSLDGKPTFRSLLAQAKDTTQGAFEHQVQPFTRVVEVLKPAFARSRTPCSRTCFVPRATTCWSSTRSG